MSNRSSSFSRYFLLSLCMSILSFTALEPVVVQAATYYVSLSGSDSNPGTVSQPFRTLLRAAKPLRPGDTLYIRGGIWTQQIDLQAYNTSGTSSAWIKIAGYPGETVTIRYADPVVNSYGPIKARGTRGYLIFENLILDGTNNSQDTKWQIVGNNHHFTLRNLEIKNFRSSGLFIQANDVQIVNCKIHDNKGARYYGIYFSRGSNGLIQGNQIYNNSGGGLHIYPGPISNMTIRGNSIHNNSTTSSTDVGGIIVQGSSSSSISGTRIYNNLVYRNGSSSAGRTSGILISYYTNATKVWNNTVYANKEYGIHVGFNTTTTNTEVKNNITYGNGKGNYFNRASSTTYSNNVTTDPKFVNASSNNFQLQSGSPAANKGVVLSSVSVDYRNLARPRGSSYDIGGYENY